MDAGTNGDKIATKKQHLTGTIPHKKRELKRFSSADYRGIRESLDVAMITLVPEELSQKRLIKELMPDLYVFKRKGYTFKQISFVLNQFGIDLSIITLREYYNEFIIDCLEACDKKFTATLEVMAIYEDRTRTANKNELIARAIESSKTLPKTDFDSNKQPTSSTMQAAPTLPADGQSRVDGGDSPPHTPPAKLRTGLDDLVVPNLDSAPAKPVSAPANLICAALKPLESVLEKMVGIKDQDLAKKVYTSNEKMEHPAIQGLMLSMEERIYGGMLEIIDKDSGETRDETIQEKMFRVKWRKPISVAASSSENDFVKLDKNLFP